MRTVVSTRLDTDAKTVFLLLIVDAIKIIMKSKTEGSQKTHYLYTVIVETIFHPLGRSIIGAVVCTHMLY